MATSQTQDNTEPQADAEVAVIEDRELLRQFGEMAVMIPADDGSGAEDILRKLLTAKTWDQLNQPWESSEIDDILGKQLRITKVTRRPSTMAGGLGIFLVVHLRDAKTGQEYVKTTSSVSVVGQLAWLYSQGATAMLIEWCRADRPSQSGFYPQHLRIIDAATPDGTPVAH